MHEKPKHPLPGITGRAQAASGLRSPADRPDSKPAVRQDATTALVDLIDGQILTRRAEIDSLTRLRRILLEGRQVLGG